MFMMIFNNNNTKIINLIYREYYNIYFLLYRDSRTLHFEVNNKLIPFFAINVPSSVHFGVFNWILF
jgi:hypothetical protein